MEEIKKSGKTLKTLRQFDEILRKLHKISKKFSVQIF